MTLRDYKHNGFIKDGKVPIIPPCAFPRSPQKSHPAFWNKISRFHGDSIQCTVVNPTLSYGNYCIVMVHTDWFTTIYTSENHQCQMSALHDARLALFKWDLVSTVTGLLTTVVLIN